MNPARPGELAALSPSGTAADVDAAITAATAAQPAWAALPAPSRGAILMAAGNLLLDRQTAIAEDLVREEGKTLAEAKGEVKRASDVLRFFGSLGWAATGEVLPSGLPDTTITTRREALGVVGLITPWNFPIAIPAWKSAPALISGNAVVIKPAELTPLSATHLARALQDAGLPAGVFNVVHGKGRVVGDALARDPRIAGLSFTGSTSGGPRACRRSSTPAAPGSSWRWAARTACWSWTTPIPARPPRWWRPARSGSPARPAPRRPASTSRPASATRSSRPSPRKPRRTPPATASTPHRWAPW